VSRAALVLAIILVVAVLLAMVFHSTNLLSHEGLESLDREIHEHQRILSAALLFSACMWRWAWWACPW
jgi:hypothetical protein